VPLDLEGFLALVILVFEGLLICKFYYLFGAAALEVETVVLR